MSEAVARAPSPAQVHAGIISVHSKGRSVTAAPCQCEHCTESCDCAPATELVDDREANAPPEVAIFQCGAWSAAPGKGVRCRNASAAEFCGREHDFPPPGVTGPGVKPSDPVQCGQWDGNQPGDGLRCISPTDGGEFCGGEHIFADGGGDA